MKRRILCGTFLLLVFSPLLVQAKDPSNERPIPNIPTPWEGICIVADSAINARAQAFGLSPQTVHECELSLHDRLSISLTVSAFDPASIPRLKISYFGALASEPMTFRFPNGTVFTAPPSPELRGNLVAGVFNGWRGPEAERVLQHLLRAPSVQVHYSTAYPLLTNEPAGQHETTLSLAGLSTAWRQLKKTLTALPVLNK
jgi:hypothetical protein